jgi:carboxymethylenebutenolidase
MYHFGERDKHITQDDVAKIKATHPEGIYYIYPADHGFNCDMRGSYDAPSAALARKRTLEFVAQHLAGEKPEAQPQ